MSAFTIFTSTKNNNYNIIIINISRRSRKEDFFTFRWEQRGNWQGTLVLHVSVLFSSGHT